MKRKNVKFRQLSVPTAIAIGFCAAITIGILLLGILSYLVVDGQLTEEAGNTAIPVVHFISMCLGGLIAAAMAENKAGIIPIVLCAAFMLALLGAHVLFIEERIGISVGAIVAAIAAAAVNLLLILRGGKGHRTKVRSR